MDYIPLEHLDISNVHSISTYKDRFNLLVTSTKQINDNNKVVKLLTMIGPQAYQLINDLAFPDKPENKSIEEIFGLLTNHLQPKNFKRANRAKFFSISRDNEESIKSFLLRIRKAAAICDFGEQLEENLLDKLISSLNMPDLSS